MKRRTIVQIAALSAATALAGWAPPALANDAARLGLVLHTTVSGNRRPTLTLQPGEKVHSVVIKLKRNDGKKQTLQAGGLGPGMKRDLPIRQEVGQFTYKAAFNVKWGDGTRSTFSMKFGATRVGKLALKIKAEDVDLDARTMRFEINNPAKRAELILVGKDRKVIRTFRKEFKGAAGGTKLGLEWADVGKDVLYMDLKVYDVAGFWKGVRLTPFSISIPHDDVEFDSGRWKIKASEEPKLDATMKHIRKALKEHGTLLSLKLYIAGYTDTVGPPADNMRLSKNRARSIARWFRKNGLKIAIFYQGFGESVLAKRTPDETPEPKNRRALYILSSQVPSKSGPLPKQDWTKL